MPSSKQSELPSVLAARQVRAQLAEEERQRVSARPPVDLVAAALAFDGWCDTLHGELGRSPTPDEQAERFEQLAGELEAAITRHQLADFWEMIPRNPNGDTLRLLLVSPRANAHQHIRDLLNSNDSLAITGPLYFLPSQLRWWVEDYFALRRLPESLTLEDLQDWLCDRKLSAAGRERLVTLRAEVGTLRAVMNKMGESLPDFEFSPRGVDTLVDRYFVPIHGGRREEYFVLSVLAALEQIDLGPQPPPPSHTDNKSRERAFPEQKPEGESDGIDGRSPTPPTPPPVPPPFYPLLSWDEIFAVLNTAHGDRPWKNNEKNRAKLRRLNEQFSGPIKMPGGRGKQPEVDRQALAIWWKQAASSYSASVEANLQRTEDAKGTTSDTHSFGRTGTVVPGIKGSVKQRKKKKS